MEDILSILYVVEETLVTLFQWLHRQKKKKKRGRVHLRLCGTRRWEIIKPEVLVSRAKWSFWVPKKTPDFFRK